ncbi:MAG TPA: hypothetical protein VHX60_04545 [Acidobacteriaceae bacterium]|jgi:tetratricopeptide (TPR) repeat protein|nr:hypothetical protein [Acidobacteriaceae bacterium]
MQPLTLAASALTLLCFLPPATPAQTALPAPAAQPSSTVADGLAALQAGQPAQALADFQRIIAADPNNAVATLYAATAALEQYNGPLAVQYAEKARALDPQSWKVHTTLVAAYTAAGMKQQRDDERALLANLHATGAPDARKASGFLLEMFQTPAAHSVPDEVNAIQYFEPMGKFHTYYRFLVRQAATGSAAARNLGEIDVESNEFDQKSWAQAHPAQAAEGERQFQITGRSADGEKDYRMFSGKPDYDAIRAMVVAILASSNAPTATQP